MIGKLFLALWIIGWTSLLATSEGWPTIFDEAQDEKHDAEIFRAVVDSMKQWELHKKSHSRAKREVSKVCYEDVGCFEDTGPFSYLEMLPSHPKDIGTRFLLYGSRKARSVPMEVPADDINDNAHRAIDPDLPTKVIVHGFGSGCDHVWVYEMRSALMTVHECNLVCVDWGPGSAVPNYVRAAANTRLVGRQLAKLIRSLNVPLDKLHLIGFSLGAHVAGFAGAELKNVSRITGLDPAGPLFESQDPRARLDETDANFVDVIHSNGEQLILGGLGSWQPMGDVDFYPNGGKMQTGCSNLFVGAVSDIIWSSAVEGRSLCNHRRAYKLFTDSVSPKCRFPAFPCDFGYDGLLRGDCFPCGTNGMDRPCGDMGYYSDESPGRGQLYLVTREEEPFCAHQYQVKVYNSKSERPAKSYGKLQVTMVGEGSFNETFSMTKKDEELLVGSILKKIVVPHPAITNLEAIEIKYTAYSGWISSGLVSWSIDKVTIIDGFGKTLSVCKRGLTLASDHAVYLPLYPGDCNIPETENTTSEYEVETFAPDKTTGIGPFTKSQNYDSKNVYAVDSHEKAKPERGLGPFTKEQNLRVDESDAYKTQNVYLNNKILDGADSRREGSHWNFVDLTNNGDSNSLEVSELERGRGFSATNFVRSAPAPNSIGVTGSGSTTEYHGPEIQEPVLKPGKKETGRSLRLPEISEPILRPRATRQNTRTESIVMEKDEIQETSPTKSFTVQFLPERLAGILAQAERYARQTLLPLISQYTPSFVGGGKQEEPKYFPPLGDMDIEKNTEKPQQSSTLNYQRSQEELKKIELVRTVAKVNGLSPTTSEAPLIVQAVYPEKEATSNSTTSEKQTFATVVTQNNDEWIPIRSGPATPSNQLAPSRNSSVSRSLSATYDSKLMNEGGHSWSPRTENSSPEIETKLDDWIPITHKSEVVENLTMINETSSVTERSNGMSNANIEKSMARSDDDHKFIPLISFDNSAGLDQLNDDEELSETETATKSNESHIQKIPRITTSRENSERSLDPKSMIFPYAYERQRDPRTRYIPLIPEEDMGTAKTSLEKHR